MSRIPSREEMWRRHGTAINSEITVARDLIQRGFEVFRPLALRASCDLLVLKNFRTLRVEVKTVPAHLKKRSYRMSRQLQIASREADIVAHCTHHFSIRYYVLDVGDLPKIAKSLGLQARDFYGDGR